MKDETWSLKYLEKMEQLKRDGDEAGVRKLKLGRFIYSMRIATPELSQSKAAKLAGISRSEWARIEAGKHLPRSHKLPDIADAIRVEPSALYRNAGREVPKKYARYDIAPAIKEFTIALQECFSMQEFINRMQIVWQQYQQDQTRSVKHTFVDRAQAQLLEYIYEHMSLPQRIRLAAELLRGVELGDVRAALPDAKKLYDDLDFSVGILRGKI